MRTNTSASHRPDSPLSPKAILSAQPFVDTTLANGLRVLCNPDPDSPVVTIDTIYRVGSRYEEQGKTGYAHLFEHLMFDGSKHLGRGEYDNYCTLAGGENNATTSSDHTNYWITLPSERFELGLWLESDRMAGFGVGQISLDTQIGVVTAEKHQVIDNTPYGDSPQELRSLLFAPGHPYLHDPIGSMEDVAAATLNDIGAFYSRYYVPANAILVVSGGIEADEALRLIEAYYGEIPRGEVPAHTIPAPELRIGGGRKTVRSPITPLNGVFLGWHATDLHHRDSAVLDVLASILAEGESSRFYNHLEYDPLLASETGAFIEELELGSIVVVYAIAHDNDVTPDELERALREQIRAIADDGPTERELEKVKNRKITSVVHSLLSTSGRAERLAWFAATERDPELVWTEADEYANITAEQVRDVARTYLSASPSVVEYLAE